MDTERAQCAQGVFAAAKFGDDLQFRAPSRFKFADRRRRPRAHLIHIGKTAGTALKWALAPVVRDGRYELRLHDHGVTLADVPRGDRVFFVLREPIDRFVSGFHSRQRQGRPRYHYPWSPEEEDAFRIFQTADSLATGLSAADPARRDAARAAMKSIEHVRDSYWRWFHSPQYFTGRVDDVLLILPFSTLTESFARLCALLEVRDDIALPTDDVTAHRNPATIDRSVGEVAAENLRAWYAPDFMFIEQCRSQPCFAPNLASATRSADVPAATV